MSTHVTRRIRQVGNWIVTDGTAGEVVPAKKAASKKAPAKKKAPVKKASKS